ncbi:MAG: hypothetical protein DRI74_08945 [Bacteroidetes bacterium]|nr:MAG: hypothetical protein DRI74_08945 [Bacteroidota bacterium]
MRTFLLTFSLLLLAEIAHSQNRDLNFYIEQAKVNSPLINKSVNDSKLLELDLTQIKNLLYKPQLSFEANMLLAPIFSRDNNSNQFQLITEGANDYLGYDLSYSDGGQYQALVTAKLPLFKKSVYGAYKQKAEILRKQNENDIVLTEHELEQLVRHQYLLCLTSKKQNDISRYLVEELNEQLQIMQDLVENAIYKQTDLMLMQIEIKNNEIESQSYQNEYQNNLFNLNLLCGIEDSTNVNIEDVNFQLERNIQTESRFLEKYQLDSLTIQSAQLLFEQKYKPQFNVFANAGMNAIYMPSFKHFGIATGINLSWIIFDGNQKKIQFEKSLIQVQTLEFEKKNFIIQNRINKSRYLAQLKLIDKSIEINTQQLNEYQDIMNRYIAELRQAQISVMDFKNLVRDIAKKKQDFLLLEMQRQALINLYNYWNF